MWQVLNEIPWLIVLVVGGLLGWFVRSLVWWVDDKTHQAKEAGRRARDGFTRFVGRITLIVLVAGGLLFALAALAQHAPNAK